LFVANVTDKVGGANVAAVTIVGPENAGTVLRLLLMAPSSPTKT